MTRKKYLLSCLLAGACSSTASSTATTGPSDPQLNKLMNEQVNPTFSKLTFLVFHGDTMEDPQAAHAELSKAASVLASATARLRAWPKPPVQSPEGREVFLTYAADVDRSAQRLLDIVGKKDQQGAVNTLEQIAKTCNDCHHFFRLNIKDSVVGPGAKP